MKRNLLIFLTCTLLAVESKAQIINKEECASWWEVCNNKTLNELLSCALSNNHNIISASNNILLARSNWRASQAGFYPSISLNAGYITEKTSQGIAFVDKKDQIGEATINATWEIDIFGSIRKKAESKKATFVASEMEYNSVMISLCGQIVEEYAQLRAIQDELNNAKQNAQLQQTIMQLTQEKYANGLATALDAAQAKSLYLQTKAEIPNLEYSLESQINTITALIGNSDEEIIAKLTNNEELTTPPTFLFNGVKANVIKQRPDIMQAEAELNSYIKDAGAAKSEYWPQFFVTAEFGYGSHQFSHFTDYKNMVWQVEPAMKWNIFSGREVTQSKRAALIQVEEGVNKLNLAISNALSDLENSITEVRTSTEQKNAAQAALNQAQITYNLAEELYRQGLTDYQQLMSAQQSLLSAQNNYTETIFGMWQATASLYVATGGGWELIISN